METTILEKLALLNYYKEVVSLNRRIATSKLGGVAAAKVKVLEDYFINFDVNEPK